KLIVRGESLERCTLQDAIVFFGQVVEDLPIEDEETTIDVAGAHIGLLTEAHHARIVLDQQLAKSGRRMNAGQRSDPSVRLVKSDQLAQVHVAHAITISTKEVWRANVLRDAPDPCTGLSEQAGLRAGDFPVDDVLQMGDHPRLTTVQADREVVVVKLVIQ